jgi:tRNA wybutosine-synthesizing protein 2
MPNPVLRPGPVERVRARFAALAGAESARALPRGFQRLGAAVLVRLPESLRAWYPRLGALYAEELRASQVLRVAGPVQGAWRLPAVERLAGDSGPVLVRENGVRFRLDPERVMFAAGNRTERRRAGEVTRPGETVVDLFAGVGYFAIPSAVYGRPARVFACEENPASFAYLCENARLNSVEDRLRPLLGDNRSAAIPLGAADRIFLGWLPSAIPFLPRALELLRPSGGYLHVHTLQGTREPLDAAEEEVGRGVLAAGGRVRTSRAREVKPYGPGRRHVVVDVHAVPSAVTA